MPPGFLGKAGAARRTISESPDRIDLITSTLGKALGGATGGFTTGRKELIELLRQRSRPYLFSNSLPPVIAAAALKALTLVEQGDRLREILTEQARWFRDQLTALGFTLVPGTHPIMPVMLGEATLAAQMAELLLQEGIYVVGFSYPVVPKGQARIRLQLSAGHTRPQLERAVAAFSKVGRALKVIP